MLRSAELQRIAASLPPEWLLVETDAYPRAPGRWTEPAEARLVAEKLAAVRGTTLCELALRFATNFQRFLGHLLSVLALGAPARRPAHLLRTIVPKYQ